VVITAHGIGAALSTTAAGLIVVKAGYSAAFLMLAGVAATGLLLLWFAMPETAERPTSKAAPDHYSRDRRHLASNPAE
jgi:predicted MFS family arabinose efflux permease